MECLSVAGILRQALISPVSIDLYILVKRVTVNLSIKESYLKSQRSAPGRVRSPAPFQCTNHWTGRTSHTTCPSLPNFSFWLIVTSLVIFHLSTLIARWDFFYLNVIILHLNNHCGLFVIQESGSRQNWPGIKENSQSIASSQGSASTQGNQQGKEVEGTLADCIP